MKKEEFNIQVDAEKKNAMGAFSEVQITNSHSLFTYSQFPVPWLRQP